MGDGPTTGNQGGLQKSRAWSRGNDPMSGGGANLFQMNTSDAPETERLTPARAPSGVAPRRDGPSESSQTSGTNGTPTGADGKPMDLPQPDAPQTPLRAVMTPGDGSVIPEIPDSDKSFADAAKDAPWALGSTAAAAEQRAANAGELPKVDPLRDTAWQMMQHVEGGEPYRERNGRVSQWGLGYNKGEPVTEDINEAVDYFLSKKLSPDDRAFAEKLDPRGQLAFLQLAIHKPAAASQFRRGVQIGAEQKGVPDRILAFHENWLNQNDPQSALKNKNRWGRVRKAMSFYDTKVPETMVAGGD